MKRALLVVALLGGCACARADILAAGTWFQRGNGAPLVLIVRDEGPGRVLLTYKNRLADGKLDENGALTIQAKLDGTDAPILLNGQPTGQTMSIRRVDAYHAVSVVKSGGKVFTTSKTELLPDGKVMKVESDYTAAEGAPAAGKRVEFWDRR